MEIKTCEEYVVSELINLKDQLYEKEIEVEAAKEAIRMLQEQKKEITKIIERVFKKSTSTISSTNVKYLTADFIYEDNDNNYYDYLVSNFNIPDSKY